MLEYLEVEVCPVGLKKILTVECTGENHLTDGYIVTPNTKHLLRKHLQETGGNVSWTICGYGVSLKLAQVSNLGYDSELCLNVMVNGGFVITNYITGIYVLPVGCESFFVDYGNSLVSKDYYVYVSL